MLFAGLRGQALYRLTLADRDPVQVIALDRFFAGIYGRLRDVVLGPDGAIYILTSNRDGRGSPTPEDDRLLRLVIR
jgi:glucose/arabinose dehydrogenase